MLYGGGPPGFNREIAARNAMTDIDLFQFVRGNAHD